MQRDQGNATALTHRDQEKATALTQPVNLAEVILPWAFVPVTVAVP
jgi:hypothetical protein